MLCGLVWRGYCKHELFKNKVNEKHKNGELTLRTCVVNEEQRIKLVTVNNSKEESEK